MTDIAQEIRFKKLEKSYHFLFANLDEERALRRYEDDKCKKLYDYLSKQVLEIKERDSIKDFNEVFSNLKKEMINLIEMKIDSKLLENQKQLEMQYINNIDKININKNIEKDFYEKEKQNKSEIENTNKKIELINNSFDTKIHEISEQLKEMNNYNIMLSNKLKEIDVIISSMQKEQKNIKNEINRKIEELNKRISNQMNLLTNSIISKKNNNELNKIDNNLSSLKNDFNSLSNNYLKEINDLKNDLEQKNSLKEKEMINFEEHFISEYENFTKFMTDVLNKNVENQKSMTEYINSDIEIIKKKNEYLEETLLRLREDVYDSIKKNIKYVLDKIHTT